MQRDSDPMGPKPFGRPSTELHVNHQGRKPLFSKDHNSSRMSLGGGGGGSRSEGGLGRASPGSRIPQPSSASGPSKRRPISLAEAFRIAQERLDPGSDKDSDGGYDPNQPPLDGSPSPAPRPWRMRGQADDSKLRSMLGQDHLDSKGGNKAQPLAHSNSSVTLVGSKGPSSAASLGRSPARMGSLDSTTRATTRSSRLGQLRSSRASLPEGSVGIPDLVPGIDDAPVLSPVERPTRIPSPVYPSPERFAWQVEEDFTAGDLQVSESPRLRVGRHMFENRLSYDGNGKVTLTSGLEPASSQNTKLHDIRTRELRTGSNLPLERPTPRNHVSKLDQIRTRESQAEQQIPIPSRHLDRLRNTKLDDIRQREESGLSRRALAAARLQEIKELNQMTRFKSVEEEPARARLYERYSRDPMETLRAKVKNKTAASGDAGDGAQQDANIRRENEGGKKEQARSGDEKGDELEWVRRLAKAASPSVAAAEEAKPQTLPAGDSSQDSKHNDAATTAEQADAEESRPAGHASNQVLAATGNLTRPKSTVTFAPITNAGPLHRSQASASSTKSKRSSMQSETDPTDRIEAEMKLFALVDNQSERGSQRAPSPPPGDGEGRQDDESTPKAIRIDPLTMPTPRVTGAYVDTPVTAKLDKKFADEMKAEKKDKDDKKPAGILRERRISVSWRNRDSDTLSEPGAGENGSGSVGLTTSAAVQRPRAKSVPRRRPPVKNSAQPASVKDDLLQLQRAYNVEDSTFDDLDELFSGRKRPAQESSRTSEDDFNFDFRLKEPRAAATPAPAAASPEKSPKKSPRKESNTESDGSSGDLATLNRMNKSLRTGILSIRTAKQGIERLEGHFAQANKANNLELESTAGKKMAPADDGQAVDHEKDCPSCAAGPKATYLAYLHLGIPRLFHRKPRFRLTLLGLLVLVASLWYAAEWAMCATYCQPRTCPASKAPCAWSYSDPSTFGTAIPIKLDQWATGGRGREALNRAVEEARDWVADMQDLALGREITQIQVETLSFEDKRQHRRRLRKKGLAKPAPRPDAETKAKWDSWHQTRLAKQRAKEAREMGYAVDEGTSARGDKREW